jgi:hypothetical protein
LQGGTKIRVRVILGEVGARYSTLGSQCITSIIGHHLYRGAVTANLETLRIPSGYKGSIDGAVGLDDWSEGSFIDADILKLARRLPVVEACSVNPGHDGFLDSSQVSRSVDS